MISPILSDTEFRKPINKNRIKLLPNLHSHHTISSLICHLINVRAHIEHHIDKDKNTWQILIGNAIILNSTDLKLDALITQRNKIRPTTNDTI